jgi:CRP-like cAMP-binding protein
MQPMRRDGISDVSLPPPVRHETAGLPSSRSTVAVLEDYVRDRGRDGSARARICNGARGEAASGRALPGGADAPTQNRLLAALDADAYAELLPHLDFAFLPQHWVVCEAGVIAEHVYFPISGVVSHLYESADGSSIEVAMTGNDGLVGAHLLLGANAATTRTVVRNTGYGYRLRAEILLSTFERCPAIRQPLLRYAHALMAQSMQTAVCHCHHRLEQQFARLLLATLDRLSSNVVALTQGTMANLLGVRRESITQVAGKLQAAGLIRYYRGRITVLNRQGLDALACECYGVVRAELDRLFPPRDAATRAAKPIYGGFVVAPAWSAVVSFGSVQRRADPALSFRAGLD